MKRTWTVIGVGDVPASMKWYQALFGQPATQPAHDYFGQVLDSDGTVLLCLHHVDGKFMSAFIRAVKPLQGGPCCGPSCCESE